MLAVAFATLALLTPPSAPKSSGQLLPIGKDGRPGIPCPLKKTSVVANVDGLGAEVSVTQTFTNSSSTPIEAVYTFPLPHEAAVNRMRIEVGARVIEGDIRTREDARTIYDEAKNAGKVAALLDQERPNIFTQSVANIMPGATVRVEIHYVEMLEYREGKYEFVFPMTVGPRYINGATPDPEKISPPLAAPTHRTGAEVDLKVNLNAGGPIAEINSVLHAIDTQRIDDGNLVVSLKKKDEIPNRDFILRYRLAGAGVQTSFVSSYTPKLGGHFSLVLMPPAAVAPKDVAGKEIIFVVDQSGSQNGFPIDKSKALIRRFLANLGPKDTFNVMGFSNDVNPLWEAPRPNNPENIKIAQVFVNALEANGGTELDKAVLAATSRPADPNRLRMLIFNTDGFVGNEDQILKDVRKYRGSSRAFAFGIGNGVNRYLIDAMAYEGRGDSEVVTLADDADGAAERLFRRMNSPVLVDVTAAATGISELTPAVLPDVFLERPVVVFGKYQRPGVQKITVRGRRSDGSPWVQTLTVNLSDRNDAPAISSLWARRKMSDLRRVDGLRNCFPEDLGAKGLDVKAEITSLGLAYGLMSEYTSFVAVEPTVVNVGGVSKTVRVPVDLTEGVDPAMAGETLRRGSAGGFGGGGRGLSAAYGRNLYFAKTSSVAAKAALPTLSLQDSAALNQSLAKTTPVKISPRLEGKTGVVSVQIRLFGWDQATLKALQDLGIKFDTKIPSLKVVIVRADVKLLRRAATLKGVAAIDPL